MRFFGLPKIILSFASILSPKNCKNHRFWPPKTLPKSIQNAYQIEGPKKLRFCLDFVHKFCIEKTSKKMRKSRILASKMDPKRQVFRIFLRNCEFSKIVLPPARELNFHRIAFFALDEKRCRKSFKKEEKLTKIDEKTHVF